MTELVQIEPIQEKKSLNACWSQNIYDHFGVIAENLNVSIRKAQEMGLDAIIEAYHTNKKFIIIEAPTGAGKSFLGMAAASYAKTQLAPASFESGAYYLTPQKSLQAQVMKDFASMGLVEMKGRSNYLCSVHKEKDGTPYDCEVGATLHDKEDGCSCCPYKSAKSAFSSSPLGVTNFAYYLNETQHVGQLVPRKMLVIDEAHNCEANILALADIAVNKARCEDANVDFLAMPVIKPGQTNKAITWLRDIYFVAANATVRKWESDLKDLNEDKDTSSAAKLGKKLNTLKRFTGKIDLFLDSVVDSPNDWIVYTDETKGSASFGCMLIKPLTATLFADDLLFSKADKVLIMSATIGSFKFFMRNLGIDPNNAVTCRIPCDFPVENRPVFLKPIANMSSTKVACPSCSPEENKGVTGRKGSGCSKCWHSGQVPSIDVAMPLVAAFLSKIMDKYATKKGIVHTHSYKVNKFMTENVSLELHPRIITHTNANGDRDMAIQRHIEAPEPTILVSPSMGEGLDLKDELSRFSVIVKLPFMYLDPYTKARMQRDAEWYPYSTALALVQATGRSNRHKEDKAHHYILDSAIMAFLGRYSYLFPEWWLAAVVWPK